MTPTYDAPLHCGHTYNTILPDGTRHGWNVCTTETETETETETDA